MIASQTATPSIFSFNFNFKTSKVVIASLPSKIKLHSGRIRAVSTPIRYLHNIISGYSTRINNNYVQLEIYSPACIAREKFFNLTHVRTTKREKHTKKYPSKHSRHIIGEREYFMWLFKCRKLPRRKSILWLFCEDNLCCLCVGIKESTR